MKETYVRVIEGENTFEFENKINNCIAEERDEGIEVEDIKFSITNDYSMAMIIFSETL